ncbi:MAG: cell division protease FtsH [Mycobacterium sp.]|jgi:ATP-dependent Zn protease|nr:cell division protease FtsH [Mycobacterium sp.]
MTATSAASMPENSTQPWVVWESCGGEQGAAALGRLARELPAYFAGSTLLSSRSSPLSFYKAYRLMELAFVREHGPERAFVLDGPGGTAWLNGSSEPMHATNEDESLALTDATVADYVRFFFYFLRADEGAFVLIESSEEIGSAEEPGDATKEEGDKDDVLTLETARGKARPLLMRGLDATGRWLLDATVAYDGCLYNMTAAAERDGAIEMTDDDPIGLLTGLVVPKAPTLELKGRPDDSRADPTLGVEPSRDREVTKAVVAVLLADAIRELNAEARAGNALLHHFNSQTQAEKPIQQLARLVAESKAMVIFESDIPFVEDVVAELVAPAEAAASVVRASAVNGDDLRCEITVNQRSELFLLSFHTYRGLFDAERTAHDLALSEGAVLIGCNRADEVPEPLQRMADLVMTFPRIDRRRFARIFEQVFHDEPKAGWDTPSADWTNYLVPGDFHTPCRLSLGPDDALSMLKDRVEARLRRVTPDVGPGMDDLHGLGEARQIAEDLIEDIRAAQAEQIPWSAVDRGLLLIGAPGTGKTTLARAVAKECGVKFVVASAANWQSAGALDAHLRAMRADFAAARRYAPAILFIDEIDSIGSREQVEGPNALYYTEVINALLEEIQGIDTTGSVIVIGATNYAEKVDPALRRAGRLDQVIEIPLPNIEGLEQIFGYYLSQYQADGGALGPDVDARALAQLAFGLTAADVEFFVRGAARRARRESRPVGQADLVAEVTRRPRRPESAPRLTPAEMHRVAVHEAGHTVARLISSTRGEDLAFTSIIPRLDGSLGFTASAPANTRVLTRRTMVEQLETVLAGRASEEVVFGADDIGAGAGGPASDCDLAVATRLATLIVCQSGLGDDGFLLWTTQPTADQDDKIDDVIGEAYRSIRTRLQACRPLLDRVTAALEEKQELSGSELRLLAESIAHPTPPTA